MEKAVDPRSNMLNTESYLMLVSLCLCAEFFTKPFHPPPFLLYIYIYIYIYKFYL